MCGGPAVWYKMAIKYFNDPERMGKLLEILLEGALTSVQIFALTLLFSIPLGMLVAVGRMSRRWYISKPLSLYIYIMRGTPLMLQVMFIYFLLPHILPFRIDRFWARFWRSSSTTRPILPKSSAAASAPFPWGSAKRRKRWA